MTFLHRLFGRASGPPRLAHTLALEAHPIGLAFGHGGRRLFVLSGEGALLQIDLEAGTLVSSLQAHAHGALALARDEADRFVASGGMDGKVCVFDAQTGALTREVVLAEGAWVEHLAWCGDTLVAAHAKHVSLIAPGGTTRSLGAHASTVAGLSVWGPSTHGPARLAVARFGGADLWRPDAPAEAPHALEWPSSLVSIAWSPDGRFLAAGCQDHAVHFWRLASTEGEERDSMLGGYASKPKVIAWAPGSDWLATASGPDVVLWSFVGEGPEGTSPLQLRGHAAPVSALAFTCDEALLLSGGRDGRLCVWRSGVEAAALAQFELGGCVEAIACSDDGAWIAAASSTGTVQWLRR